MNLYSLVGNVCAMEVDGIELTAEVKRAILNALMLLGDDNDSDTSR